MIVFNRFREIKIVRQDVKLDTMATSVVHEADDLNTCAVCFEQYNFVDRLPKFLSCLHTFCISCLGVNIQFCLL